MTQKVQLNVRIAPELYEKVLNCGQSRAEVVTDALTRYFDNKYHQNDNNSQQIDNTAIEALVKELNEKNRQLEAKDRQITEVHILLQNAMAQKAIKSPNHKSWWRFWQR